MALPASRVKSQSLGCQSLGQSLGRADRRRVIATSVRSSLRGARRHRFGNRRKHDVSALRRLESHGLLLSEWREENKRRKRFYRLSRDGEKVLEQLLALA